MPRSSRHVIFTQAKWQQTNHPRRWPEAAARNRGRRQPRQQPASSYGNSATAPPSPVLLKPTPTSLRPLATGGGGGTGGSGIDVASPSGYEETEVACGRGGRRGISLRPPTIAGRLCACCSACPMGFHLLAFVAARGFLQVFNLAAPLLWPLNLWLPSPRRLPEACAAFGAALASHGARLRGAVYGHRRGSGVAEHVIHALVNISDSY